MEKEVIQEGLIGFKRLRFEGVNMVYYGKSE
jgi:hypothetical protein